jgi:hypothetical protein
VELADREAEKFAGRKLDAVHFAWAGGVERGQPHYYRLQTTIFTRYGGIPQGISRTTCSHATTRTPIRVLDSSRDVAVLAWVAMEES